MHSNNCYNCVKCYVYRNFRLDADSNLPLYEQMLQTPNHLLSESMIQAEFFSACRYIELPCALELMTPAGRLDAAIFTQDWLNLVAVVEVKTKPIRLTPQIWRYKRLGLPVFGLHQFERAHKLAEQIKRQLPEFTPIPLEQIMAMDRFTRGRGRKHIEPDECLIVR